MSADLFKDKQFQELEKEYKFLSRARGRSVETIEAVIFDLETTGLEPALHEITEIGALKVKGDQIEDMFSSLVKPRGQITLEITRLTGIDTEMVADAPPIEQVLPLFVSFAGPRLLIAHNADFDSTFVREMLRRTNQPAIDNPVLCTVKLARHLLPGLANYKLRTVAAHFGLKSANLHRAMGDVELLFQVWTRFLPLLKERNISSQKELEALIAQLN
ncbi:MAG: 3'-5' exonuclease [Candidatus Saganbacteria bacterium]|nr:3'-5' exonuclease [Candidatus Saganbacteria bacterium]